MSYISACWFTTIAIRHSFPPGLKQLISRIFPALECLLPSSLCSWIMAAHKGCHHILLLWFLLMVALCNRCRRYIFALWFLSIYFPRLISGAADWMSAILWHMLWPYCEFRMQVWNVLRAARWKCRTQKVAIWAPSHNFVGLFATKERIDNRKKNLLSSNISSTCPHNMVNFGPLAAEICWRVWGTPANFNRFRILAALLHCTLVVGVR